MRSLLALVTALLVLLASSTARAEEKRAKRPHLTLLVTGSAIAVGTYGVTASMAATGKRASDRDLFVPVVGPLINLSNRNCAAPECVTDTADLAALWASAGLQMLGVGLVVTSAFVPERASTAPRPQDVRLLGAHSTTTVTSALVPATTSTTDAVEEPAERRPHRALLWTGVSVFTATYAGSVVAGGVAGDRVPDKNLFVPLVGPWLDLGQRDCDFRPCDPTEETLFKSLIVASGVLQAGAAVMTVSSFFISEKSEKATPSETDVRIVPMSYAGGGGVGVVGLF